MRDFVSRAAAMSRLLAGSSCKSEARKSVSRLCTSCRAGSPGLPMQEHAQRFSTLLEAVTSHPAPQCTCSQLAHVLVAHRLKAHRLMAHMLLANMLIGYVLITDVLTAQMLLAIVLVAHRLKAHMLLANMLLAKTLIGYILIADMLLAHILHKAAIVMWYVMICSGKP